MPTSQGRVTRSVESYAPGSIQDQASGRHGEVLTTDVHGKFYHQAVSGNMYYTSTVPAGLAIPIQTTTAPLVMLWNPTDSGKNVVLARLTLAQVSGTSVAGPVGLVWRANAGSEAATGHTIAAFAQDVFGTNLFNARAGAGNNSVARSSSQGTNTITAGTWIKGLAGISAMVSTSQANNPVVVVYDFDGDTILAPGNAVFVGATAASSALFAQTLSWIETPV